MNLSLLNYKLELHCHARHKWSHFKVHNHHYYKHLVWGKLSLLWGQPHLVPIEVCSHCKEQVRNLSAGDEGWTFCEGCHQIEGDTEYITSEEYEAIHG